ncbi:MAG TPA: DNA mismatch repair protein MutS [Bacteroidales bacterium]|nr:DNA mismatch repair protein MutS [Bacteroidales bacterium]HPS18388.1 DNA mismatch repair protein MutS [Bacteroidales bacterium]
MKQYLSIKAQYPDAILLFRVGDFYETFGEDAIKTSGILGIVLTRRANGSATFIELAGFPHHALDTYLPKLVKSGHRVAICDQLEDPKLTKKIVKRGVTELVTPGVSLNDKVLDHKTNNFLASIHFDNKISGISFLDISTGEFFLAQGNNEYIDKLIQSFRPNEVIIQKNKQKLFIEKFGDKFYISTFEDWVFTKDFTYNLLLKHFGTTSLKGFGVENLEFGIIAAGSSLHYLTETQHDKISHISKIQRIEEDHYVWLDRFTIRNLELLNTSNENAKTLIDVIDTTLSPMGSRLMKRWMLLPLKDKQQIDERLNVVEYLIKHKEIKEIFQENIKMVGDLERLISKVAVGKVSPREVMQIKKAFEAIIPIKEACSKAKDDSLKKIADQLNPCQLMVEKISKEIVDEPPVLLNKGNVINKGVSEELDELRDLAYSGKDYLLQIQQREIERTGISSLKVAYNNVFGYYIEVTNTHKDKVPAEWQRKQTLVNAERYITEELKIYEEKILGAEEKISEIETKIFNELVIFLMDYIQPIQLNASLIARLDCLLAFASNASKYKYYKPEINESLIIDIKKGRHPVIEQQLPIGEEYISNDIFLDNEAQQIIIITGPNMSGKSALLRQTALIVLMAQMGSFVPAEKTSIGLVDKIFTRVGASDNISSGESTFMVEMNETASILNNISDRSLILLDEIGRGTSTYDGISIAWAIAQYLHEHPLYRAKTLFATHYHELNEMAVSLPRIRNFHVSVKEINNKVIFLRKLLAGGSEHSFGIHVAKMAGMPTKVIETANDILVQLEKSHSSEELTKKAKEIAKRNQQLRDFQLSFIQLADPLLEQIKEDILNTNIDTLTPVEALMKLNEIKKLIEK